MNRYDEYLVCRKRSHQKSVFKNGEWEVCKYCGTWFKFKTEMVEDNLPTSNA